MAFGIIATVGCAAAATVTVNCPSQSINAAITNFFTPGGRPNRAEKLILNVSGTCTENVYIPPLRDIELVGVPSAVLRPSNSSEPVLLVQGLGVIRNFNVGSTGVVGFPRGMIQVGAFAFLGIGESVISSTTAKVLVQGYLLSQIYIRNSFISGGVDAAVTISENSQAFIVAENGGSTTIRSSSTGAAIGCYQANLTVWARGASSRIGIGPAERGVEGESCTGRIGGFGEDAGFLRITGTTDTAIGLVSGDALNIFQTSLTGNSGAAVTVRSGTLRISSSIIGNNGSGLHAEEGAVIVFDDNHGPNNVFQSGVERYNCYQGGKIYAGPGDITGAVSTACLTVGGSVTH